MTPTRCDAVIVGAGPAGFSAAILLARALSGPAGDPCLPLRNVEFGEPQRVWAPVVILAEGTGVGFRSRVQGHAHASPVQSNEHSTPARGKPKAR